LQVLTASLQGFVNAIAFGVDKEMKLRYPFHYSNFRWKRFLFHHIPCLFSGRSSINENIHESLSEDDPIYKDGVKYVEYYQAAIQQSPQHQHAANSYHIFGVSYYNCGVALSNLGRYEEAIDCYKAAITENSKDANAYNDCGITLCILGRYKDALQYIQTAIRLNPNDAYAHKNCGIALSMLGKDQEAIKCYQIAIRLNPKDANLYYNCGIALGNLGYDEMAVKYYQNATQWNPKHASAYYNWNSSC
jgi:tetratricopeptide (TPR) repeat protein